MEWYTVRAVLKIFVDRELLTAWGTYRSAFVTPALSPTIYKVRLISRTRSVVLPTRVWNIGRELAETAYEVKFRSNITDFVRLERGSSWPGKFGVFEQPKIFWWVSSFIFCQLRDRRSVRIDRLFIVPVNQQYFDFRYRCDHFSFANCLSRVLKLLIRWIKLIVSVDFTLLLFKID